MSGSGRVSKNRNACPTNRDALELNEMGRRYGFDVRLRYVREDVLEVGAVEKPNIIQKKE